LPKESYTLGMGSSRTLITTLTFM